MMNGIHLQHLPLIGNFIDKYFPQFCWKVSTFSSISAALASDRGGRGHGHD